MTEEAPSRTSPKKIEKLEKGTLTEQEVKEVSEQTTLTDPIPQTTQQTQTTNPEKISVGIETEAPLPESVPAFSLARPGTLLDSELMVSANHVASSEINPNPVVLGRETIEKSQTVNFSSMVIESPLNPEKNLTESEDFTEPQNLKENLSKILLSSMEPQLTLIKSKKSEIEKQGLSWGAFESYADSLMEANQKLQSTLFTIPDANEDLFDSMKTDEIQESLKKEQPKEAADPFKPTENEQKLLAEIGELKSQVESLGEGLSRKNRVLEQLCQVEKTLKKENGDLSSKVGDLSSEVDRLKTNYKEKVYVLESELTESREKNSILN